MRKYDPLMNVLNKCEKEEITLSYEEIEKIIGDKLPATAHKKKEWWSNNDITHTQSSAWSDVGFEVISVILGQAVTFRKVKLNE